MKNKLLQLMEDLKEYENMMEKKDFSSMTGLEDAIKYDINAPSEYCSEVIEELKKDIIEEAKKQNLI